MRVDGELVNMTRKTFDLLLYLAAEPTRVFSRRELLRDVWGFRLEGQTRTLDTHAMKLRKALGVHGHQFVIGVWGVGYRLSPVVASTAEVPAAINGRHCPHCGGRLA